MSIGLEPPCLPAELPVGNQLLITIAVEDNKLSRYPTRENDIVVFHRKAGYKPVRPNQVRWVAIGLSPGQKILIEPKAGQPDVFDPIHAIVYGKNTVCSGSPKHGPAGGARLFWSYSIRLLQNDKELDVIDPDIEIKDDP